MKWQEGQESENVEDRRGQGGNRGLVIGGGAGVLILLLGLIFGLDPAKLQQFVNLLNGGGNAPQGQRDERKLDPAEEEMRRFTSVVFRYTEKVWEKQFEKMGRRYENPTLDIYDGVVESACGTADSAVGPFYCPGDSKVYIDLSFYRDMQRKLHAPGEFARAYVIAHEVGHHVQRLLGYDREVNRVR